MKFTNIPFTKIVTKNLLLVCAAITLSLSLSSCAREISSDVYTATHVGETSVTYAGMIRSVRCIRIEQEEQLQDNSLGVNGGAIVGGVAGNVIGRGDLLPTAIGAIAGAVAGSLAEKKLKQQSGVEYIVELDGGNLITIVQGPAPAYWPGQFVYVMIGQSGRSRIIPQ